MLKIEDMVESLALSLSLKRPSPDAEGTCWFDLDAGMRLGVQSVAGGRGCLVKAVVSACPTGLSPSAAEDRAGHALKLRLARLRRNPSMVMTMENDGTCIVYQKLAPDSEHACRQAVSELLNEAEVLGKLAEADGGEAASPGPSLFSSTFLLEKP